MTIEIRLHRTGPRDDRPARPSAATGLSRSPASPAGRPRPDLFAAALFLLCFWFVSLNHLGVAPPVYEDEPWQASTGYKLATEGVFGSDMFAGFYNKEQRYYGFLPLHPLLLALYFRLFGLGLFQARLETVTLGLLALALTYALGRRLFKSDSIATLSVLFLLTARLNGVTPSQPTGILFLDIPRIARYDMVVPVFGLAALHAFLSARRRGSIPQFVLCGALCGLAGLGHLYGVFWLPALLILALWDGGSCRTIADRAQSGVLRARLRAVPPIVLGFVLVWLPYLAYVVADLPSFRGQGRIYAEEGRFSLLSPGWYLENLLREPRRYGPGLEGGRRALLRPGFWASLVGLPLSLAVLSWNGIRRDDSAARVLVVPAVVIGVLFALLLRLKLANYLVTLAPLAGLAVAWGTVRFWRTAGRARRPARAVLLALWLAVLAEGLARVAALDAMAGSTTPYADYIARVHRFVPAGARVLGLHNYWIGLEDTEYRAIWVPLRWTDPSLVPEPLPFDTALERVAPDYLLLDPKLRGYFASVADPEAPGHQLLAGFERWMARHDARLIGHVEDPTYGRMDIYRVRR